MVCWQLPLEKNPHLPERSLQISINGLISLHFKDQSGYYKLNGDLYKQAPVAGLCRHPERTPPSAWG